MFLHSILLLKDDITTCFTRFHSIFGCLDLILTFKFWILCVSLFWPKKCDKTENLSCKCLVVKSCWDPYDFCISPDFIGSQENLKKAYVWFFLFFVFLIWCEILFILRRRVIKIVSKIQSKVYLNMHDIFSNIICTKLRMYTLLSNII